MQFLEINKIHHIDFFDAVSRIKNDSIDLIVCDDPYGVTDNDWDKINPIQDYNLRLIQIFESKLKQGGALYLFGKQDCIDFIDYRPYLSLQSKIIWYQPSRLAQGRKNFTNNYDLICYFTKGKHPNTFNLDDIRVPQLVELEHRIRCEKVPSVTNGKYGKTKFNDKGKNPGNVWGDIKQLTYKSKELLSREVLNTIQKLEKLMERFIKASSNEGDLVLDPFCGVGTCPLVCKKLNRRFIGIEQNTDFIELGRNRLLEFEGAKQSMIA
ncbi:MAG: DNA methyltransferase [Flavobacteriaceae bacterium]|nr:DNA methyltransferase [Flavobacteriaceae bacterium]MCY4266811.1 DNA methyltransferase [Flavobacteriaceae bacterium]